MPSLIRTFIHISRLSQNKDIAYFFFYLRAILHTYTWIKVVQCFDGKEHTIFWEARMLKMCFFNINTLTHQPSYSISLD
jgi:hypothetical protein